MRNSPKKHKLCTLTALVLFLLVSGCASSGSMYRSGTVESRIHAEYAHWRGTPYLLGGTTKRGVDCSAFVQNVYADAFGIDLPRSTADQVREGRRVQPAQLKAGDLVFFRPPGASRHVGIYLENGTFTHASTSQGVTLGSLEEAYWQSAYWTSRRLLDNRGNPPRKTRDKDRTRPERQPAKRPGW
ncbi:MAG: hypothetical protein F4Y00_01150 [Bacteroidetes bacterium SB0662_bin_6]|nr:hypothetical protein [Bacteroidetes bacterium SB0668_bin_1]MYE03573.1 hypothetical protein [Bacteroidetes bacterium SB0662_bin_6]